MKTTKQAEPPLYSLSIYIGPSFRRINGEVVPSEDPGVIEDVSSIVRTLNTDNANVSYGFLRIALIMTQDVALSIRERLLIGLGPARIGSLCLTYRL